MGYYQEVSITFAKKGFDPNSIWIALNMSFPKLISFFENNFEFSIIRGNASLTLVVVGKSFYDGDGIFEGFGLKDISQQLECDIELKYFGEESMDGERLIYDNGKLVKRQILGWVDA